MSERIKSIFSGEEAQIETSGLIMSSLPNLRLNIINK